MRVGQIFWALLLLTCSCDTEQDAGPATVPTFIKLFGGPNAYSTSMVMETSDGGYILLGTTHIENEEGGSESKIRLIKLDINANTTWDKQYPETIDEGGGYSANSLIITDNGYLVIGDRIHANETSSMLLLHVNTTGDQIGLKEITITDSNDTLAAHGIDMLITLDNELKVTGIIESAAENLFVGTLTWPELEIQPSCTFRYSSSGEEPTLVGSTSLESNGDIVFGTAVKNNSRLIRVPGCQNTQVTGPLLRPEGANYYTISQIAQGSSSYGMVGTTNEHNNADIFLALVDSYGDNPRLKVYTEVEGVAMTNDEEGFAINSTDDGGFILAGSTLSSTQGELDIIIIKTDIAGNVMWSQRFGDQNEEYARSVVQTSDGGFLIAGNTEFGGIDTMVLIKTDNKGEIH